jgi:hypothetical protein
VTPLFRLFLLLPLLSCFVLPLIAADTLESAADELAEKIVALAGRADSLRLSVKKIAQHGPTELQLRTALEGILISRGVRLNQTQSKGDLIITLSENRQNLLLIAEIHKEETKKLAIVSLDRLAAVAEAAATFRLHLEKKLLWEQGERILDAALLEDGILILDSAGISLCQETNGRWTKQQSRPISRAKPWPRDLRGRLQSGPDTFEAYLPGIMCRGRVKPELQMSCEASQAEWPLQRSSGVSLRGGFEATRNFFGYLVTEQDSSRRFVLPFFSAALVHASGKPLWLLAEDNGVHLYDREPQSERLQRAETLLAIPNGFAGWGTDFAGLQSPCAPEGLVLAAITSDAGPENNVRAFEFMSLQPVVASHLLSFPGSVTALWPAAAEGSAIAVVRDPKTGRYAVYRIDLVCGG